MGKKTRRGNKNIVRKRLKSGYVVHLDKCYLRKRPKAPLELCTCRVEDED